MKRFVWAVALAGVMSMTVLAGEIPTNDVAAPPPTTSNTASTTSTVLVAVILTVLGRR